jgi:hypothetical protein
MYLNFSIKNFFYKKNNFKAFFSFHKKLSKYKFFEMECLKDSYHLFSVEIKIGFKEDHAGIRVAISAFGVEVYAQIYDSRHWDFANNCWQTACDQDGF